MVKAQKTKEMKFKYFVSYSCIGGFGNCEIFSDKEIDSFSDLQRIKKSIEGNNVGVNEVIILNYVKLK